MNNFKARTILLSKKIYTPLIIFGMLYGGLIGMSLTAHGASDPSSIHQDIVYAGSQSCAKCHKDLHSAWSSTRHANAFSSPIFQRDWTDLGSQTSCLSCHTTGFNPQNGEFAEEGITCEACHGPFQSEHPQKPMPMEPNAELCTTCHKTTTDEWKASPHNQAGIQCQSCHNPHSQTPMAESITALCSNCHKERGDSFTHGTHANAGLECSNCHMYKSPRSENPIQGLVPTGHTFTVGSEACIGCHQDTVHSRDELLRISGETTTSPMDSASLEQKVVEQEQSIQKLEAQNSVRLYTGLAQGSIIGLITGGAAAWVVSRKIQLIEVDNEE